MWEIFKSIVVEFFDGLIFLITILPLAIMHTIPVPAFLANSNYHLVPDSMLWFASAFELNTGFAIMSTCWFTRFIIRRTPIIG